MTMIRPETEMKDSGVQWIGNIPNMWSIRPVKSLYTLTTGFTPNSKDDSLYDDENGEVWVTISDMKGDEVLDSKQKISKAVAVLHKNEIAKKGSLLYSFKLSVGLVAFAGRDLYTNEAIAAFQPKSENGDLHYLKYASSLIIGNANTNIYGSSIMNQKLILNAPLPVPPLSEQQAIADYLDEKCSKIDEIISEAKASIEEYDYLRQSVIHKVLTKGLNENTIFKDSGIEWIGKIPVHWNIGKVKYGTTKVGSGKTPKGGSEVYSTSGVLFLRSQNVYNNGLKFDNLYYISDEIDEEMKNTRVQYDDVLLNITGGSIGRCCIFSENIPRANVNQHVCIIRVDKNIFLPEYMHLFWISPIGQISIKSYQTGGNREGMSAEAIKNTPIPMISIREQRAIVDYIKPQVENINALILEKQSLIEDLEAYKKSLIYEVVTGKRRVV